MSPYAPDHLETWTARLLRAAGAPDDHARTVAESLVSADVRGHASHGLRLLPAYLDRIGADSVNRIDPTATPTVVKRSGPRVLVDGSNAFGRVVGDWAADESIALAGQHGLGVVGIRDGNHLGRMGEWAERAAEAGLLFLTLVKAEAALVAPPMSATRRLSTNPIAAGVPTFDAVDFPIVLDMATSVESGGKVRERAADDRPLPAGWAVDAAGDDLRSPERFLDGDGALRPLGAPVAGHKGFGLGVVAELFGALLGDGVTAGERDHVPFNNSAAFVTVDPTWFTPPETIAERIERFVTYVREAERYDADGAEVRLPGEPEHLSERRARTAGVSLAAPTVAELNRRATDLGVDGLGDGE